MMDSDLTKWFMLKFEDVEDRDGVVECATRRRAVELLGDITTVKELRIERVMKRIMHAGWGTRSSERYVANRDGEYTIVDKNGVSHKALREYSVEYYWIPVSETDEYKVWADNGEIIKERAFTPTSAPRPVYLAGSKGSLLGESSRPPSLWLERVNKNIGVFIHIPDVDTLVAIVNRFDSADIEQSYERWYHEGFGENHATQNLVMSITVDLSRTVKREDE